MFWPCETRTSICRNLATISSGLYRFLAITVLLDVKDIPQVGPLQWGWITAPSPPARTRRQRRRRRSRDAASAAGSSGRSAGKCPASDPRYRPGPPRTGGLAIDRSAIAAGPHREGEEP